jgi:hypothetical protein
MRSVDRMGLIRLLTCLLALSVVCVAQAPGNGALTNADIVKMMRAGLPESIIVREIRQSGGSLNTSPDALIQLKKLGASERILSAVLDSHAGPEPPEPYAMSGGYGASHPHMPSFQADVRVKSNKQATISVGHNHVAVQKGGAPVFSVTWENTEPSK